MRMFTWMIASVALLGLCACTTPADNGSAEEPDEVELIDEQGADQASGPVPDEPDQGQGEQVDEGGDTPQCTDTQVFVDSDGDGFGVDEMSQTRCLEPGEQVMGYARMGGDCDDSDPIAYSMSEGVCGDNVDDDCDGADESCPASQPEMVDVPSWDCMGAPPENVYAYALFADGADYFQPNGCFVFFEGAPDRFYIQRINLTSKQGCSNESGYGCVCPSEGGWPSYDRRLYAFTLGGEVADCPEMGLTDHAGEDQPVSNSCRKYLYQLHRYPIPYSHVAASLDALEQRIDNFPRVEIACLADEPHANLPFASLLTAPIERHDGFVRK